VHWLIISKDAGIVQEIRKNVDSFRKSGFVASQFGFVLEEIRICTLWMWICKTNSVQRFILWIRFVLGCSKDPFCGFNS
jgi:hypothetical protein